MVAGVILAVVSGYFITPDRLGIDVEYMGFPLEWRSRVIPTHIEFTNWVNLFLDFVFWTVIVFVISGVAQLAINGMNRENRGTVQPVAKTETKVNAPQQPSG